MHCTYCGRAHAPGVACQTFAAHVDTEPAPTAPAPTPAPGPTPTPGPTPDGDPAPAPTQPAPSPAGAQFGGPTVVNPHWAPAAQVRDPLPYRFSRDGGQLPGSPFDFSSDLINGFQHGDTAARARIDAYVQQAFAVTPANVTNLNYPANRADLYVDQMEYEYPIYQALNAGTLTDITPFVIPKFSTATGLVADHTTGTEPTPGAFTATAQTITPTPVSGKIEITREAWDQGGNPQMSGLIWRQMVRGWYEALEAYAVAQLVANAASITDLTITTAATDATLDQAITNALVPLQYIRGGFRFRTVFTQVDLYKAMAAAKDTAGRRLYPTVNPMNAQGQTAAGYAYIDAHGLRFIPAWATAATSVNAASSYMLDPEKVMLWASAPRRIDLEWRVAWVDVGLWGYKAFGITDFAGARELVYDPV